MEPIDVAVLTVVAAAAAAPPVWLWLRLWRHIQRDVATKQEEAQAEMTHYREQAEQARERLQAAVDGLVLTDNARRILAWVERWDADTVNGVAEVVEQALGVRPTPNP